MATSERDLVESIIKAVSNDETAPKQKHVRGTLAPALLTGH